MRKFHKIPSISEKVTLDKKPPAIRASLKSVHKIIHGFVRKTVYNVCIQLPLAFFEKLYIVTSLQ